MTRAEMERERGETILEAGVVDGTVLRPTLEEANLVRLAIDAIRGRWAVPVLTRLCVEPTQFNQLQRDLAISSKVLTDALRRLERDGLVTRTPPDQPGKPGAYTLTPRSAELQPALRALSAWARAHGNDLLQSRIRFDEAAPDRDRL